MSLKDASKVLKKIFKESPIVPLDDSVFTKPMPHISTSVLSLDYLIGGKPNQHGVPPCPGFPRGRVVQLYGNPGAGKTTLALTLARETIKAGGTVVYIDWENEIDPRYADAIGVPITDEDKFVLVQPDTLEDGFKCMWAYAKFGADLIVVDSVGAGVPEDIFHQKDSEQGAIGRIGLLAAKWSGFLPKLKGLIAKSGTLVLGISQIRSSIPKGGRGPTTNVQGGNAWKFYSCVRMMLRVVSKEKQRVFNPLSGKQEEIVVGTMVNAKLDKCKVSPSAHGEALFYLGHGEGIDSVRSVVEAAVACSVIKKGGAWYRWTDLEGKEIKGQGMKKFLEALGEEDINMIFGQLSTAIAQSAFSEGDFKKEEDLEDLFSDSGLLDD